MVARRITKPQRFFLGSNLTGCSFLFSFFLFFRGGGGSDFIILYMSYVFLFIPFFLFFLNFYSSRNGEITLLFTDILVNHALVTNFDVANMYFNDICVGLYVSEFTVVCVVTDVLHMYMCLIHCTC